MDWLTSIKQLVKKHPHLAISVPTLLSCSSFLGNLFTALSDGHLDGNELHQLMSSANGCESLILIAIMVALKQKKN